MITGRPIGQILGVGFWGEGLRLLDFVILLGSVTGFLCWSLCTFCAGVGKERKSFNAEYDPEYAERDRSVVALDAKTQSTGSDHACAQAKRSCCPGNLSPGDRYAEW